MKDLNSGITMVEGKIEYLQMIQEPIGRMSTASAIFKGFTATIVAGLSAIAYGDVNMWILGLSFIPVLLFALLDVYYLRLERKYRYLYEQVRLGCREIDFSMDLTNDLKAAKARLADCVLSPSILLFYLPITVILVAIFALKMRGVL